MGAGSRGRLRERAEDQRGGPGAAGTPGRRHRALLRPAGMGAPPRGRDVENGHPKAFDGRVCCKPWSASRGRGLVPGSCRSSSGSASRRPISPDRGMDRGAGRPLVGHRPPSRHRIGPRRLTARTLVAVGGVGGRRIADQTRRASPPRELAVERRAADGGGPAGPQGADRPDARRRQDAAGHRQSAQRRGGSHPPRGSQWRPSQRAVGGRLPASKSKKSSLKDSPRGERS